MPGPSSPTAAADVVDAFRETDESHVREYDEPQRMHPRRPLPVARKRQARRAGEAARRTRQVEDAPHRTQGRKTRYRHEHEREGREKKRNRGPLEKNARGDSPSPGRGDVRAQAGPCHALFNSFVMRTTL